MPKLDVRIVRTVQTSPKLHNNNTILKFPSYYKIVQIKTKGIKITIRLPKLGWGVAKLDIETGQFRTKLPKLGQNF